MDSSVVGDFILACREAKQVLSLQPQLPSGIDPRDLRILDTVAKLSEGGSSVRMSDVSARLNVSRPNVTRDMGRLAEKGLVRKTPSERDRRTVFVSLTEEGAAVNERYVTRYHEHLAGVLEPVGKDRLEEAARTIRDVHALMAADREAAERAVGAGADAASRGSAARGMQDGAAKGAAEGAVDAGAARAEAGEGGGAAC